MRGYAYVELLLAVALLAFSLAPMLQSLAHGFAQQALQADSANVQLRAQSALRSLDARSYAELMDEAALVGDPAVSTAFSESPGTPGRVLVFLSLFDHDNADADDDAFTGGDPELLWIRVASERGDVDYQTLRAQL